MAHRKQALTSTVTTVTTRRQVSKSAVMTPGEAPTQNREQLSCSQTWHSRFPPSLHLLPMFVTSPPLFKQHPSRTARGGGTHTMPACTICVLYTRPHLNHMPFLSGGFSLQTKNLTFPGSNSPLAGTLNLSLRPELLTYNAGEMSSPLLKALRL